MIKLLKSCLADIAEVQGDIVDFGVYSGDNFIRVAKLNNIPNRNVIGIVNYSGLEEPSEHDVENDGSIKYFKGRYNINERILVDKLNSNLKNINFCLINSKKIEESLDIISEKKIAFAIVDLYQYLPTKNCINYLINNLQKGGLVLFLNFHENSNILCNKAIKELMDENHFIFSKSSNGVLLAKKATEDVNVSIVQDASIINVVCVLKTGGTYDYNYVNALANGIKKHTTLNYKFTCITDDPTGFNENVHEIVKFKHNFPKWWGKIELFRPDILKDGNVFFLDLDTVIVDNIDLILFKKFNFCGLRDFYKLTSMGSGLMCWKTNNYSHVYHNFLNKSTYIMNNFAEGDQKFIDMQVKSKSYFQDHFGDAIVSWKKDCVNRNKDINIPKNAKIICFHGVPKPHEIEHPLIKSNWIP